MFPQLTDLLKLPVILRIGHCPHFNILPSWQKVSLGLLFKVVLVVIHDRKPGSEISQVDKFEALKSSCIPTAPPKEKAAPTKRKLRREEKAAATNRKLRRVGI